jgi:membrane-associated protease RseP (regulator of RpoE activity)
MNRKLLIALAAALGAALLLLGGIAGALIASSGGSSSDGGAPTAATSKGYLGLTVSVESARGLRVATVEPAGPAATAGIQVGDILRSIDGQVVRTPEQLRTAVESHKPGERVSITYERGERELQARAVLTAAPANAQIESTPAAAPPANQGTAPNQAQQRGRLAVTVQPITPALQQRLNLQRDSGVVVTQVTPGGAGAAAGLQTGDVILSVAGVLVGTVDELQRQLLAAPVNQAVDIGVQRGAAQITLKASLPPQAGLQGLENILPPALREQLQRQIDNGTLQPEQLQQILRLYQARGENLRVGTVRQATEASVTLQPYVGGPEVTVTVTPQTSIRRGSATIRATDLRINETIMVLSMDGGVTAFQVIAYGVLP